MADPDTRTLEILTRSVVFGQARPEVRAALAEAAERSELERRHILFGQGAKADAVFVLGAGRVRLLRRETDGREITLGYRGAGDLVGDTGWVEGTHSAEARALERLDLLRLPGRAIDRALADDARIAKAYLRVVGRHARELEGRLEALLTRPVESRVASFLVQAASRHGVPDPRGKLIGVKFTHQEIASYVGSTRETVTLILGDLKRRGLLAVDHRRVVVLDVEALAALV